MTKLNRNIAIAGSVILFHLAALWMLQSGLFRRTAELVVPVRILSEIVTSPAPKVEPSPAASPPPKPAEPVKQTRARKPELISPPAPRAEAIPDTPPAPNAPTGVLEAQPAAPPIAGPVAAEPPPAAPSRAPAKVEPPSSDASYLQNPVPVYPPISKRLGEQGQVVVRVLIGADGVPQKAELKRSSGFDRLDQSALEYVMKCRYAPGKVGGEPRAMWYDAPVSFVLQ